MLFVALIGWITDFMWFGELGYISVFLTKLFTQLKIGVPTFVIVTFLAYIYLKAIKRGYMKKIESEEVVDQQKAQSDFLGTGGCFWCNNHLFCRNQTMVPGGSSPTARISEPKIRSTIWIFRSMCLN